MDIIKKIAEELSVKKNTGYCKHRRAGQAYR